MNTQIDVGALSRPFPAEYVKTRKGHHNQDLSYVEAVHYLERLNEVFKGSWSFRILEKQVSASEVIVRAELEAGGIVKQAFGGASVTTAKDSGEMISLADDLKAAATDALKKCASLFGVGLELYAAKGGAPANGNGKTNGNSVPTQRNRLTAKQLGAIYAIGRSQGLTDEQIKQSTLDAFGVAPEFLSFKDASAFIDTLKS